jgi:signal transduction histidine kinase
VTTVAGSDPGAGADPSPAEARSEVEVEGPPTHSWPDLGKTPAVPPVVRPVRPDGRLQRAADRLPDWMGSVRFRLTAIYSLFLFGLAALVVGGLYLALADRLNDRSVYRKYVIEKTIPGPNGKPVVVDRKVVQARYQTFEQRVDERSLEALRGYSFEALGLLFLASLAMGWIVAGRVLAPIDRIIGVARDIQATDLSLRIGLTGPPDELKDLADTFDGMLARIDDAFEQQRLFIQEASHELRNPLAVIRTNLDVALDDPSASTEDLRQAGEVVRRAAERMSHLVDDLLAHAREGDVARQLERLDVSSVVEDTTAEFRLPAEARGLTLDASGESGLWVMGDRVALRQALANLLANAVRLAPEGTTIRAAAGRRSGDGPTAADRWVWLAVEDQGPGIAPDTRELVFQRFWRGDGQRAREEGRSGLGLTIVRQIAEHHRGEVRVMPNDVGGSTFVIWLPAADPAAPPT